MKPNSATSRTWLRWNGFLPVIALLAGLTVPGFGQQAPVVGLWYGANYQQVMSFLRLDDSDTYYWEGWAAGYAATGAPNTYFISPDTTQLDLTADTFGAWSKLTSFDQVDLQAWYPPGTYQFHGEPAADPQNTFPVALASGAFPPAPTFLNINGWAFPLPPGNPLDVSWKLGTGTLPTDWVQLVVEKDGVGRVFATPFPGQPGALTGTSTGVHMEAKYFTPGAGLNFHLNVYRPAVSTTVSGWEVFSGSAVCTTTPMQLQGSTVGNDARYYSLLLGQVFSQTESQNPAPVSEGTYRAEALAIGNGLTDLHSAVVQPPGLPMRPLVSTDGGPEFSTNSSYATESALLADWPGGSYQWTFEGITGKAQGSQTLTPAAWPDPLVITSWTNLANPDPDPNQPLTIAWAKPPGALKTDQVEIHIVDATGHEAYGLYEITSLPGDVNSITISAQRLDGNTEYTGHLRYVHVLSRDETAIPGALGVAGQFSETQFKFQTARAVIPPSELSIATTSLPDVAAGSYCDLQISLQGGVYPFQWSLIQGALPPGVDFAQDLAALQGLPTQAGKFDFTVQAQDSIGVRATRALSLSVTGAVPALTLIDTDLPAVPDSFPYFAELATDGGALPITWSIGSGQLPPGLELSAAAGIISGQPTQSGTYTFEVEGHDAAGQFARRTHQLVVPPITREAGLRLRPPAISPGGMGLELNAAPGDPVTVQSSTDLRNWTTVFVGSYSNDTLRSIIAAGSAGFYRALWGQEDLSAPSPLAVTPLLNTNVTVTAVIGTAGGSLVLTGAVGTVFKLAIPTNALESEVEIRMTEIAAVQDLPFTGQFCGAVELSPSGTRFTIPARLTMTLPGPLPKGFTSFAAGPEGHDFYICPTLPVAANAVDFLVMHFSSEGGAVANPGETDRQSKNHQPCHPTSRGEQMLGAFLSVYHTSHDPEAFPTRDELWPYFRMWFDQLVWPALKRAEADPDTFQNAVDEFFPWARFLEGMLYDKTDYQNLVNRSGGTFTPSERALLEAGQDLDKGWKQAARDLAAAIIRTHVRAIEQKDPWLVRRMLDYYRDGLLSGLTEYLPEILGKRAVLERIARVWRFTLDVRSRIEAVDSSGGRKAQEVRSGRVPIEWDPDFGGGGDYPLYTVLSKRFSTFLSLKDFYQDGTYRIHPGRGRLTSCQLGLLPKFAKPAPADCPADCPYKPVDVGVVCYYQVEDPQPDYEVMSELDGTWHTIPGNVWSGFLAGLNFPDRIKISDFYGPKGSYLTCYLVRPSQWKYLGGDPLAKATYDFTTDGTTESMEWNLRFAPKPLRSRDVELPDLAAHPQNP